MYRAWTGPTHASSLSFITDLLNHSNQMITDVLLRAIDIFSDNNLLYDATNYSPLDFYILHSTFRFVRIIRFQMFSIYNCSRSSPILLRSPSWNRNTCLFPQLWKFAVFASTMWGSHSEILFLCIALFCLTFAARRSYTLN